MSHNVETMFYAGDVPWHGLGVQVESEVTAAAAIKLAGLDWTVEKRDIFIKGQAEVDGIPVIGGKVPYKQATVRTSDGAILGVVGENYKPIQNIDCFDFMDGVVGEGQAVYHTAGSLNGGRVVWILMKLPRDMMVGNDRVEKFLLLSTSHDGSRALNMRYTPVRVVCQNTLSAAENVKKAEYTIYHTTSAERKIMEARHALGLAEAYYQRMEAVFNRMLEREMGRSDMNAFTEKLLPADAKTNKVSTQTLNIRHELCRLFTDGIGHDAIKHTRWAAYNAVTEYVDHYRKPRATNRYGEDNARFEATIFGSGAALKQKAFSMLATL